MSALAGVPLLLALGALPALAASRAEVSPAHAGVFVPEQDPRPDRPIVLLGASFAADWRLPDIAGSAVVNRGIGGQQSFELLERFDRDVVGQRPRAVIIWGYINDVYRAPRDSLERVLERARESFAEMIRKARAADIEVIVATEILIGPRKTWSNRVRAWIGRLRGKEGYDAYVNRHVSSLNDWLRALAASEGLLLLDLEAALSDSRGRRVEASAQPDGGHVSPFGYELLTAYALPILVRHFSRAPGP